MTFLSYYINHREEILQHINSVNHSIILTTEETRPDGSILFLDTLIASQKDGTLRTSVYRMPTNTDLYLQQGQPSQFCLQIQYDQHPHTQGQGSVFQPQLLERELQHLKKVLIKYKYPKWAIDKVLQKPEDKRMGNRRDQSIRTNQTEKCHIVMPSSQGLCKRYKTIYSKYGVQVNF